MVPSIPGWKWVSFNLAYSSKLIPESDTTDSLTKGIRLIDRQVRQSIKYYTWKATNTKLRNI